MNDRNGPDLLQLLVASCSVGASWKRCLYFTLNAILNAVQVAAREACTCPVFVYRPKLSTIRCQNWSSSFY